jgi:transposase
MLDAVLPILSGAVRHDATRCKSRKSVSVSDDFRKFIDGLAALVELDIKVAVFDPVLFVFLNKPRNRVKILYWERNGFCLWLKRLESERFKTSPDFTDEAIVLTVQ